MKWTHLSSTCCAFSAPPLRAPFGADVVALNAFKGFNAFMLRSLWLSSTVSANTQHAQSQNQKNTQCVHSRNINTHGVHATLCLCGIRFQELRPAKQCCGRHSGRVDFNFRNQNQALSDAALCVHMRTPILRADSPVYAKFNPTAVGTKEACFGVARSGGNSWCPHQH